MFIGFFRRPTDDPPHATHALFLSRNLDTPAASIAFSSIKAAGMLISNGLHFHYNKFLLFVATHSPLVYNAFLMEGYVSV